MHVLNHIDNKLGEHGERVEKLFAEHMEDEMERYEQIQRRQSAIMETIEANNKEAQDRHKTLSDLTSRHIENTNRMLDMITGAFPIDEYGKPDLVGHRNAHKADIDEAIDGKDLKRYVKRLLFGATALVVGAWIILAAWQTVLKGPSETSITTTTIKEKNK